MKDIFVLEDVFERKALQKIKTKRKIKYDFINNKMNQSQRLLPFVIEAYLNLYYEA